MSTAIRVLQGEFGRVELLNMDRPLVRHAHSQCHVLVKIGGADGFFSVKGQRCALTQRTAVLINAWEPHAYLHHATCPAPVVILALYIEPHWLSQIDSAFISSATPLFFPHPCASIPGPVRSLSDALAMEMLLGEHFHDDYLQSRLADLMVLVIDAFADWRRAPGLSPSVLRPRLRDARIRHAIAIMRENAGGKLDTEKLAARVCLSKAHFFRLFLRETHLTPSLYNNIFKVEFAVKRLADPTNSVNELSTRLGFSAQSHFTRFFRQHTGIAPSQYRRIVDVYKSGFHATTPHATL